MVDRLTAPNAVELEDPASQYPTFWQWSQDLVAHDRMGGILLEFYSQTGGMLGLDPIEMLNNENAVYTSFIPVPVSLVGDNVENQERAVLVVLLRIGSAYSSVVIMQNDIDYSGALLSVASRQKKLAKGARQRNLLAISAISGLSMTLEELSLFDRWNTLHPLFQALPGADQLLNENLIENWVPFSRSHAGRHSIQELSSTKGGRVLMKNAMEYHAHHLGQGTPRAFRLIPVLDPDGKVLLYTTSYDRSTELREIVFSAEDSDAYQKRRSPHRPDDPVEDFRKVAQKFDLRTRMRPNVALPRRIWY
ncbi:hypothetical protein H6763_03670 [Candidatus Nomurabacteria bacterium]|uniref:Uncharacterized protein n=1 Tax=Candidatus Dojkabacteria bacterium TaxID=2099670 RepID=A0A955I217_9BACT|nr:hypothetical protein [Candidatus Dojkabacteria bacterium]MCB9803903.1 hypothetical protein [Candidatus Nomurabacteria bacterium]